MLWLPDINQWGKDLWKEQDLLDAVREGNLILFVGNGISRLSDPPAPAWENIAQNNNCRKVLKQSGINRSTWNDNPLDIAQVFRNDVGAWKHYVAVIKNWMDISEPNIIHGLLKCIQPKKILTTNVDDLLERKDFSQEDIIHIHGEPNDPESWVFARNDYFEKKDKVIKQMKELFPEEKSQVALFLGYGHSADDFDVIESTNVFKISHSAYSLIPDNESKELRKYRIMRSGIIPIEFPLPQSPTSLERKIAFSVALLSLMECANVGVTNVENSTVIEEAKRQIEEYNTLKKKAALIVGIASKNTYSLTPENVTSERKQYPNETRSNMPREEYEGIGGPGAITALILSELEFPVILASRIVNDEVGKFILKQLENIRDPDKRKGYLSRRDRNENPYLHLDFLDISETINDQTYQSWKSYVLVHPKSGQRNFLDRYINLEVTRLSLFPRGSDFSIFNEEIYDKEIYFDKYFYPSVIDVLSRYELNPEIQTWTFYETGGSGNKKFDNSVTGKVNFGLCSFMHAQNFVGEGIENKWVDFSITNSFEEEIEAINGLLGDENELSDFRNALLSGGKNWLKDKTPGIIIVTLHQLGCLWLDINEPNEWEYRPSQVTLPRIRNTAGAGDVFRGAFMAGIKHIRSLKELSDPFPTDCLNSVCDFANLAAGISVKYITIEESISEIREAFEHFKGS